MAEFVYLDTQAYEAAAFNFAGKNFTALKKHLDSGRLRLLTTDITKAEAHKRIDRALEPEFKYLKELKDETRILRGTPLPGVQDFFSHKPAAISKAFHDALAAFFTTYERHTLKASAQDAEEIFEKYFNGEPPFGVGDKRKEFPDAFVISVITEYAENNPKLLVVSGDNLFRAACEDCEDIIVFEDMPKLLDHVASDDEKLATFLRAEILKNVASIQEYAKTSFEELGFYVIDEWGDVEMTVTNIELYEGPELLEIGEGEVSAELRFSVDYDAELSFEDSDTGTYDSEVGGRVFKDQVEETISESELVVVTIRAVFEGTDEDAFEIHDMELRDPSTGFGIKPTKHRY